MRAVLLAVGLATLTGLTGCGRKSVEEEEPRPTIDTYRPTGPVEVIDDGNVAHFADQTGKYRGLLIQAELTLAPGEAGKTLRDHVGGAVTFHGLYGGTHLRLTAHLPAEPADVPDAREGEPLFVTFTCRDGSLTTGNEVVRVTRTPDRPPPPRP